MRIKMIAVATVWMAAMTALSQDRDAFVQQQAYAEMQRVSGQVGVARISFDGMFCRNDIAHRAFECDAYPGDSKLCCFKKG